MIEKLINLNDPYLDMKYIWVISYNPVKYNIDAFLFGWGRNIRINLLYHYFKGYNPINNAPYYSKIYHNYTLSNRIYFICA